MKIGPSEDIESAFHPAVAAFGGSSEGLVHRLLDRLRPELRLSRAQTLLVKIDQVLRHPTSISASYHIYLSLQIYPGLRQHVGRLPGKGRVLGRF